MKFIIDNITKLLQDQKTKVKNERLHDTAPAHTAKYTQTRILECEIQQLDYPL